MNNEIEITIYWYEHWKWIILGHIKEPSEYLSNEIQQISCPALQSLFLAFILFLSVALPAPIQTSYRWCNHKFHNFWTKINFDILLSVKSLFCLMEIFQIRPTWIFLVPHINFLQFLSKDFCTHFTYVGTNFLYKV